MFEEITFFPQESLLADLSSMSMEHTVFEEITFFPQESLLADLSSMSMEHTMFEEITFFPQESLLADLSSMSMEHTVFEEITSLFESMETDMIKAACSYVFTDVQARSQPYRKDR